MRMGQPECRTEQLEKLWIFLKLIYKLYLSGSKVKWYSVISYIVILSPYSADI